MKSSRFSFSKRRAFRFVARLTLLIVGLLLALPALEPREAVGTQHDAGQSFPVTFQNEGERSLFFSLICKCGCPRETLGTCQCSYANTRRNELRAQLAEGLSLEAIQEAYARRFGPESVAVPPNRGSHRLIWLLPIVALILGAYGVVRMLKRWKRQGDDARAADTDMKTASTKRDAYDDKLDQELDEMGRE
jgi:cytochrome c-type biogenesis protein CcmH